MHYLNACLEGLKYTQETSVCAMAWLFVAGILTQSPALDTKLLWMGFVVDKVLLKQGFSPRTSVFRHHCTTSLHSYLIHVPSVMCNLSS
jgi:hypothetical protein